MTKLHSQTMPLMNYQHGSYNHHSGVVMTRRRILISSAKMFTWGTYSPLSVDAGYWGYGTDSRLAVDIVQVLTSDCCSKCEKITNSKSRTYYS